MKTLVEDPTWIIVLGIAVEAVLAVLFMNLRKGVFAWAMLGVLALVLAGVGLESLVVTDTERVEAAIYGAADAVEENDLDRLLADYISPRAIYARRLASDTLAQFKITSAKISNLRIAINYLTSPPTAEAKFIGTVRFEDRKGRIPYRHYPARLTLPLELEGDRWMVVDPVEYTDVR
jgi:hypothetical protein